MARQTTANQIFAQNMRIRRKVLGISQEKLGELCGLHRTYIGGIEQETRNPSLKNVEKICDVLKIPVSIGLSEKFHEDNDTYAICEMNKGEYKFKEIDKDKIPKKYQKILNDLVNS